MHTALRILAGITGPALFIAFLTYISTDGDYKDALKMVFGILAVVFGFMVFLVLCAGLVVFATTGSFSGN